MRIEVDPKIPIRSLDYTVIFARQMAAMRAFYGTTLGFPLHRELGPQWVEFRIGAKPERSSVQIHCACRPESIGRIAVTRAADR